MLLNKRARIASAAALVYGAFLIALGFFTMRSGWTFGILMITAGALSGLIGYTVIRKHRMEDPMPEEELAGVEQEPAQA